MSFNKAMIAAAACASLLLVCVAGEPSEAAKTTCGPVLSAIVTACTAEGESFAAEVGITLPATNEDIQAIPSDKVAAALANIDATPGSSCCKAICAVSNTVVEGEDSCGCNSDFIGILRDFVGGETLFQQLLQKANDCGTLHHSGTECGVTPDASTCQA
ncbi:hypothetical protein BSKO_11500 [Bryopsis sp. KO-2023]|nr:hypothetical protein BSKO_11500 [Bryopsis sp. KO-2023]